MAEPEVSLTPDTDDLARYLGTEEPRGAETWQLQAVALVRRLAERPLTEIEYAGLLSGFQRR